MNTTPAAILLALLLAAPLHAEPETDPPPPSDTEDQTEEEALPSLDDLLDLEDDDGEDGGDALDFENPVGGELEPADETGAAELEKALRGEGSQGEPFVEAVAFMDDAAKRITGAGDLSLNTQRIQEDAIDRLEKMIAEARESQQQQQQQSSSSSSQSQQQTPDQQEKTEQREQTGRGNNDNELTPPGAQEAELNPVVAAAQAAWGALPERVREALVQGSAEEFSSLYRGLTEEYYQRLAEEPE